MKHYVLSVLISLLALRAKADVLASAGNFAVLGGSTVTNNGLTLIDGDIGVWRGTAITGFPPGIVSPGTIYAGGPVAQQAQSDAALAYGYLQGLAPTVNLTGVNLGGLTLAPGVYFFASVAQLTGILTLNGEGDDNAVWVFQIGSALTTAADSSVQVINGAPDEGLYWLAGSSATLGSGTEFEGNILADASITLDAGAAIPCGRALAGSGAVTLDGNAVSIGCGGPGSVGSGGVGGFGGDGISPAPEPAYYAWLPSSLFVLFFLRKFRKAD